MGHRMYSPSGVKPARCLRGARDGVAAAAPASRPGRTSCRPPLRPGIGRLNVGRQSLGAGRARSTSSTGSPTPGRCAHRSRGRLSRWTRTSRPPLPPGRERLGAALVGVTYTIDVLRLVPYADAQLGIAHIGGPLAAPVTMFASELGIGGDYYLTRRLRAGLSFQYLYQPAGPARTPREFGNSPFTVLRDRPRLLGVLASLALLAARRRARPRRRPPGAPSSFACARAGPGGAASPRSRRPRAGG